VSIILQIVVGLIIASLGFAWGVIFVTSEQTSILKIIGGALIFIGLIGYGGYLLWGLQRLG
jgi:hypothetical protein